MLKVKDLSLRHKGSKTDVLSDLSFHAEGACITTILGPNGSGKTSLLKCISGLWRHYKGEILFDGRRIDGLPSKERARLISFVPQEHDPAFPYTVHDIVLMGRACHLGIFSLPGSRDYEVVEETLRMVGIFGLKEKPYTKISGGERQLTLIARALSQQAPCILLDEPTSHLDFKNQVNVLRTIKRLAEDRGLTVIMTLHDPNLASLFSDKIVILVSGTKLAEGRPSDVISEEIIERVYGLRITKLNVNGRSIITPVPE